MVREINKELYSSRFTAGYLSCWEDRIKNVSALVEGCKGKLLDIGCGDGSVTKLISSGGGRNGKLEPYGVDIVDSNIKKAVEKGVKAQKCDLEKEKLPFGDAMFDVVHAGEVLEHLAAPETLLEEVHRVLRPDGAFIASVPNVAAWYNRVLLLFGFVPYWIESGTEKAYGTPYGVVSGHVKAFTKGALVEMLGDYGFEVEKIVGCPVDPAPAAESFFQRIGTRVFYAADVVFSLKASLGSDIICRARKKRF